MKISFFAKTLLFFSQVILFSNACAQSKSITYHADFNAFIQTASGNFAQNEGLYIGFDENFAGIGLSIEKRFKKKISGEFQTTFFYYEPFFFTINAKILNYNKEGSRGFFWGAQIGYCPLRNFELTSIGLLAGTQLPFNERIKGRGFLGLGLNGGSFGGIYFSAGFGIGIN